MRGVVVDTLHETLYVFITLNILLDGRSFLIFIVGIIAVNGVRISASSHAFLTETRVLGLIAGGNYGQAAPGIIGIAFPISVSFRAMAVHVGFEARAFSVLVRDLSLLGDPSFTFRLQSLRPAFEALDITVCFLRVTKSRSFREFAQVFQLQLGRFIGFEITPSPGGVGPLQVVGEMGFEKVVHDVAANTFFPREATGLLPEPAHARRQRVWLEQRLFPRIPFAALDGSFEEVGRHATKKVVALDAAIDALNGFHCVPGEVGRKHVGDIPKVHHWTLLPIKHELSAMIPELRFIGRVTVFGAFVHKCDGGIIWTCGTPRPLGR